MIDREYATYRDSRCNRLSREFSVKPDLIASEMMAELLGRYDPPVARQLHQRFADLLQAELLLDDARNPAKIIDIE